MVHEWRACESSRPSIAPPRIHALFNSERVTGNSGVNVNCCKQAWLLKNSLSAPNNPKLGDAKCLGIRKHRLNRSVTQSCFREFLEKEFFDSHGIFQQYSRARGKPRDSPQ
jgi:hypothetical protein